MVAHVADEIDADAPLGEAPLPIAAFEAVTVPAADDGLQRHAGQRLQHGEIRARDRRAGLLDGVAVVQVVRNPLPLTQDGTTVAGADSEISGGEGHGGVPSLHGQGSPSLSPGVSLLKR
jgi:hypothetical protein